MEMHNFIRGWLTVTAIASIGNCFQCLSNDKFLTSKIYDRIYRPEVSSLYQRLFLIWQSYLVVIQLTCIMRYDSGPLYFVTVASYVMVFTHFSFEAFYYHSASMNMGVIANLSVSGLTVVFMLIAWRWVNKAKVVKEDFKKMQKFSRKRTKME